MVSSRTFIRVFRLQMGHKTHLVALTANLHNRVLLFFLDLFQIGERNPAFPLPAALELFLVSL